MRTWTKVKYREGDKVQLEWQDGDEEKTLTSHQLVSREAPAAAFGQRLSALVPHVTRILELPEMYAAGLTAIGISISHGEDTGYVITCLKKLQRCQAPVVINTPHLTNEALPASMLVAINAVLEQAERFLAGDREQVAMFPAPEQVAEGMRDSLKEGESVTISSGGRSVTMHGRARAGAR